MKLKQYLYEFQQDVDTDKSRVKPLENTEAFKILKTKCERAFAEYTETGRHIQRYATGRKPDFGTMDASKMPPRLSRNTLNYYTLVINDDSIWRIAAEYVLWSVFVARKYRSRYSFINVPNQMCEPPYDGAVSMWFTPRCSRTSIVRCTASSSVALEKA